MKKLDVNQELCRKVQIMLAGAKMGEVARLLGIGKTTVSRIKAAGFDPETYRKNTEKRVAEENRAATEAEPEQVQGQISMDDLQAEEPAKEMSDQVKLMRFLAGKFADNSADHAALAQWIVKVNGTLDKINDNLCQILRKMDG